MQYQEYFYESHTDSAHNRMNPLFRFTKVFYNHLKTAQIFGRLPNEGETLQKEVEEGKLFLFTAKRTSLSPFVQVEWVKVKKSSTSDDSTESESFHVVDSSTEEIENNTL